MGWLEEVDCWGCAFEEVLGPGLFLYLSLLPGCHEVSSFAPCVPLLPWSSALPQTQNNGASQPWTEAYETVGQNKTLLLQIVSLRYWSQCKKNDAFCQSICHLIHLRWLALLKGFPFLLLDSCTAPMSMKIAHQITCPNPSPKPFGQSRKIVNLWPGQIPGKGQVQLCQEKPLTTILCSHVHSADVNTCLHPFDQKKLPCQDFLCLPCVCFQQRTTNSNEKSNTASVIG
jgi:hypothetical protein